ncbi:Crp/Fnr family transcriptional regulator [Streptomyces chryseus]|uniref:Crp/Fnr family transcriptional regulator n=1 Tax=Streptomyces chryseus TaxID=68186 RepID=UPI00110F79C6|nr:Crp/Fnr family transcriptional regulator [Streptomyces chryseus]GGX45679.1 Crp/Fnr family transcriptional regulator [Streptomyces chryseus]
MYALPAEAGDALLALGSRRRYANGQQLLAEGDSTTHAILLVDASVKVSATTADGRSTLLAVRHSGDLVGEMAALDGRRRVATVTAVGAAKVQAISQQEFRDFLHRHPLALAAVSRQVVERLRAATRRRVDFAGVPVQVRLCRVLAEWCEENGSRSPCRVALTQYELATLIGAAEVSVSRALRALAQEGVIRTGYRWVEIPDCIAIRQLGSRRP